MNLPNLAEDLIMVIQRTQFNDPQNNEYTIKDDSIWIVDKTTGCYFKGTKLIHNELCECGDYNES